MRPRPLSRLLDIVAASAGLTLLAPLMCLIAILIKLDSAGPVLFSQIRIGRGFRPFRIFKFRTMIHDAPSRGRLITAQGDSRITRVGEVLRSTKLDEIPQLFNVIRGDMSLVGPRPEVPRYVELFPDAFRLILSVRPGITDLATLEYRDEQAVLANAVDPEQHYVSVVLPRKLELASEHIARASLAFDLLIILRTLFRIVWRRSPTRFAGSTDGTHLAS